MELTVIFLRAAGLTHAKVRAPVTGRFSLQPLCEWITTKESGLLD